MIFYVQLYGLVLPFESLLSTFLQDAEIFRPFQPLLYVFIMIMSVLVAGSTDIHHYSGKG
jgi:hypothetical protein